MTTTPFVELHTLAVGTRFMFYADDLEQRGPCTLVEKGAGGAVIEYEPHETTRRFKARDKSGQIIEKEITATVSGKTRCALGAQVVAL